MRALVWKFWYRPTCADTAGVPAKRRLLRKARDMIVTVSPILQPAALPPTVTRPPRCTVDGVTARLACAATAAAVAEPATASASTAITTRGFTPQTIGPPRYGTVSGAFSV